MIEELEEFLNNLNTKVIEMNDTDNWIYHLPNERIFITIDKEKQEIIHILKETEYWPESLDEFKNTIKGLI